MSLERNIERIADALEAIASTLASSATLATAPAERPASSASNTIIDQPPAEEKPKATTRQRKPAETKPEPQPEPQPEPEPEPQPEPETPAEPEAPADPLEDEVDPLADDEPAKKYTKDDVRSALRAYQGIEGSAAMMEVLRKAGADSLASLSEDKYAEVMAAVK